MVFEVQQNSDVTFRLYDWDRVDAQTGQPRPLQVDQAMACIDFAQGAVGPVTPVVEETKPVLRERLFLCEHFALWRLRGDYAVLPSAQQDTPRVLVCIAGDGQLEHDGTNYAVGKGDVAALAGRGRSVSYRPRGCSSLLKLPSGIVLCSIKP